MSEASLFYPEVSSPRIRPQASPTKEALGRKCYRTDCPSLKILLPLPQLAQWSGGWWVMLTEKGKRTKNTNTWEKKKTTIRTNSVLTLGQLSSYLHPQWRCSNNKQGSSERWVTGLMVRSQKGKKELNGARTPEGWVMKKNRQWCGPCPSSPTYWYKRDHCRELYFLYLKERLRIIPTWHGCYELRPQHKAGHEESPQ